MLASQAFIINYLWPIMSIVFACIILKEKMTAKGIIAIAMSFLGVIIVSGISISALDTDLLIGTALCLFGAASYGLFTALTKKFSYDITVSMMFSFFASFALSLVINLVMGTDWTMRIPQVLGFAWNGVFSMAASSVCWALALNKVDTAKISNLAYITPVLSLIWVFIVLHEPIVLSTLLGLTVILFGILVQIKDR